MCHEMENTPACLLEDEHGTVLALRRFMRGAEPKALGWILFAAVPIACSGRVNSEPRAAGGAAGSVMTAPSSGGVASPNGEATPDAAIATAGSGGVRTTHGIPVCESPTLDASSQLVVCANGFAHRAQPSVCEPEPSAGSGGAPADDGQSSAGAGGEFTYGAAVSVRPGTPLRSYADSAGFQRSGSRSSMRSAG